MLTRPRNHEPIPWRHSVVSTPLFTGATVYAAGVSLGVIEDLGGTLPLGWIGLGSALGIATAAVSRWIRTAGEHPFKRWFHTGFTVTWTSAAYAWINLTANGTPWSLKSAAALAVGTAVLTPAYAVDRYLRSEAIAAQWAAEAAADRIDQDDLEALWHQAGARGVKVGKPYGTPAGHAYPLQLTQTPYEQLLPLLPRLEVAKGDVRAGSMRLERGDSGYASDAILHISTRNVLGETIPLPPDAHPITINEPLTLGDLESGEPIEILFRQNSILICGKKGSGKSVLLHVIIAAITRCTDAVIWMIDMAQGNTAKRWLRPWVEEWTDTSGRLIDRPILDWVATSEDEAVRMLNAAHAIADGRARRMKGGKIVPKPSEPAIILISDENSDLMAWNMDALKPKTRLLKKGRKAAIDVIDAVQRGTGPNTGGGEISSQYDTVIGMKFAKKAEGQFVFPDYYNEVDLSKLPGKGSLYLLDDSRQSVGGKGPERGKVHFANDDEDRDDIEQLSAARWNIRPDLDKAAQADAAPYGYADRWSDRDRIEWLCDALGIPAGRPAAGTGTAPARPAQPSTSATLRTPLPPIESYLEKHKDWRPDQQPTAAEQTGPADPAVEKAIAEALEEFERINEQATVSLTKPSRKDRRHPRRDQCIEWVREAGEDGISVAEVRDRLSTLYPDETPPSDTAIQNWYAAHPNINKPGRAVYFWTEPGTAGE